jgi:hypothetical protein
MGSFFSCFKLSSNGDNSKEIFNECIEAEPWYFGKIKRYDAEKLLLLPVNDHGAFLIRDSESTMHNYSLSGECVLWLV